MRKLVCTMLISSMSYVPMVAITGCESLPGDKKAQGAVIGGAGGALAGALIGRNNRLVGGLIGGALGASGGYLVGSELQKTDDRHRDEAIRASDRDRDAPPTASEVERASTADLNNDGYVTLNEVVAMQTARLSNKEMIHRLEDTGQVFSLGDEQESYLQDHGVSQEVIVAMRSINQDRAHTASAKVRDGDDSGRDHEPEPYRGRTDSDRRISN